MMEKKYLAIIVIMIFLLNLTGCASVEGRGLYPGVYPGVRHGIDNISGRSLSLGGYGWGEKIFYLLDLPLSFVMDTFLLPFDAFQKCEKEEGQPKKDNNTETESKNTTSPAPK